MIRKITSGRVVERRKSWVGRRPSKRSARVKGTSSEKKQENNRQQAALELARILNCNYRHGDALLTLTFADQMLETAHYQFAVNGSVLTLTGGEGTAGGVYQLVFLPEDEA